MDDNRRFTLTLLAGSCVSFSLVRQVLEDCNLLHGLKIDESPSVLTASFKFSRGQRVRDRWVDLAIQTFFALNIINKKGGEV
jgi:hypothetical protein